MKKVWIDIENESFSGLNEEQWLEEIMDQYGDRLTKLSYSYLHDWGRAQEVVQDVFLICYKQYDTYLDIKSFKAWIYRVTINRCKDVLKSSWINRVVVKNSFFQFLSSKGDSPEMESLQKNSYEELAQSVLALPVKYREVIHLFYYEDLSVQEMSVLLKINQNTIKTRLSRGREMLGNILERGDSDEG
ncbi:sigma-70 family RNA polymerase sigma factor [Paenisporosarcina sp. TG20]|uniref:sigma-70 family RNA polymerase sigma factor n=1 Tax=Paenisporosarcina sp. TG20 TaxID=1211706 RepID=UPI0002EFEF08|nr:sigma-70 family RNA polymerase sigma factor [Paenisporosarcina sp. TG20]